VIFKTFLPVALFHFSNQKEKVMKNTHTPFILACLLFLTIVNARAQDTLTVNFLNMTPHVGQDFYLRVVDTLDGMEVGRASMMLDVADFEVEIAGIMAGQSYHVDFWADHNQNGQYDPPGTDHAWRITLDSVLGDTTITFTHNTDFTDIAWPDEGPQQNEGLTIAFSDMTPHLGQQLYLALKSNNGWEIERRKMTVDTARFDVTFDTVMVDSSYMVDFWADHNNNGRYDDPPDDHTWRITVDSIRGDTTIPFIHNTNFTELDWMYKLTVEFTGMSPHLNQILYLYLRDQGTGDFIDNVMVDPIVVPDFSVYTLALELDTSYNVDFYVDFNENGMYDVPPADHAWRIELNDVAGDTTLHFAHNTDFTDIELPSDTVISGGRDLEKAGFSTFPNPVKEVLTIRADHGTDMAGNIRIFSQTGALLMNKVLSPGKTEVSLNVASLKPGVYILSIGEGKNARKTRFIKE